MHSCKLVLLLLAFLLGLPIAHGQITNTGLPISITEGAILSTGSISSQGALTNNGLVTVSGDIDLISYTGEGSLALKGEEQTLDFGAAISLENLTTAGSGRKTFQHDVTVNGLLTLTDGWLTTGSNDFLLGETSSTTLGTDLSYVEGKLIRIGSNNMLFPVGAEGVYAPLTILPSLSDPMSLGVEVVAEPVEGVAGKGLLSLSNQRFWSLTDEAGDFTSAQVQLAVRDEDLVDDIDDIAVAYLPEGGDTYQGLGRTNLQGDLADGSVLSSEEVLPGRLAIGRFFDEQLRINDSLALVALYEETAGDHWINQDGWGDLALDDWFGLTLVDKRIDAVGLPSNNLTGNLSDNSIPRLTALTGFDLSGNLIYSLPKLNELSGLESADVSDNALDFSSLEDQDKLNIITYVPQGVALTDTVAVAELRALEILSREIGGDKNSYTWLKDEVTVEEDVNGTFRIPSALLEDEGAYTAQVTNSNVPGLTISTEPVNFYVSSLERDRRALLALYGSTNGPEWTDPSGAPIAGWNETDDLSTWSLVRLNDAGVRVEGLDLGGVGLDGEVPAMMTAMTFLNDINMGNNEITQLPLLAGISELQSLDVSNNRLGFDAIQRNLGIPDFSFSPQRLLAEAATTKVPQGTDYTFDFPIGGEDLTYRWFFNGEELTEELSPTLSVDSVSFEDMGNYSLMITDELVTAELPGFSISTDDQELLATANITGRVQDIDGAAINEGEVTIWGIRPIGSPYDSIGTYAYAGDEYLIPDVVLGDYIHWVIGDLSESLPSYYESSFTWSLADTVQLRQNVSDLDIVMINQPDDLPFDPENDNTISGLLELDTDNFPPGSFGNRTLARRRVRRAGCAFNRALAVNRGEDDEVFELIAYVLTDENGEFDVPNLPDGLYRVQIEFPGIPMDPNSFVEFELGGAGFIDENSIRLAAEVTPQGIVVTKVRETGVYRDYFKNLNVFPNPADDYLSITYERLNTDGILMQVMDLNGALQLEQEIPQGFNKQVQLEVDNLKPGLYIMTFMDQAKGEVSITSLKFLIQR